MFMTWAGRLTGRSTVAIGRWRLTLIRLLICVFVSLVNRVVVWLDVTCVRLELILCLKCPEVLDDNPRCCEAFVIRVVLKRVVLKIIPASPLLTLAASLFTILVRVIVFELLVTMMLLGLRTCPMRLRALSRLSELGW